MKNNNLTSLTKYSRYIAELLNRPTILHSTVSIWSDSPYTGITEGEIFFPHGFRLRIREELDFDAALISSYGYEAYHGEEKLFWYDDFPHPSDQELASTFPHHKHIPPNIKRHRIPALEISFTKSNLFILVQEMEALIEQQNLLKYPE